MRLPCQCGPKTEQSLFCLCYLALLCGSCNMRARLYTHTYAGQEADAVAALPDLGPPATKAAATGTDDESVNVRAARAKKNLGA